jgi:hypothetical protein
MRSIAASRVRGRHVADPVRRLARWRVPLGFGFAMVVIVLARPTRLTLLLGGVIAIAGESLRVWAAGHLNKSREVTCSGPYRWFAHPLYVGSSILGAGLAVASASGTVAVVIALYLTTTIFAAIKSEEAYLRARFGSAYEQYRGGDRGARDSGVSTRRFSLAQAIANREHRAVAGVVLAVLLLSLKAAYNGVFGRAAWPGY